jgi:hypothetical protein
MVRTEDLLDDERGCVDHGQLPPRLFRGETKRRYGIRDNEPIKIAADDDRFGIFHKQPMCDRGKNLPRAAITAGTDRVGKRRAGGNHVINDDRNPPANTASRLLQAGDMIEPELAHSRDRHLTACELAEQRLEQLCPLKAARIRRNYCEVLSVGVEAGDEMLDESQSGLEMCRRHSEGVFKGRWIMDVNGYDAVCSDGLEQLSDIAQRQRIRRQSRRSARA